MILMSRIFLKILFHFGMVIHRKLKQKSRLPNMLTRLSSLLMVSIYTKTTSILMILFIPFYRLMNHSYQQLKRYLN